MPFISALKYPTAETGSFKLIMGNVDQELAHLKPSMRLLLSQIGMILPANVDAIVAELFLQKSPKYFGSRPTSSSGKAMKDGALITGQPH